MKERIELRTGRDCGTVYERFAVAVRFSGPFRQVTYWLCLILLALPVVALAQTKPFDSTAVKPVVINARDDRAPMRVRYPTPEHLRDKQTDHDYQYTNDAPPPENPLARFWVWLMRKIGSFLASEAYQNVWQYVLLVAIAGTAIYLLMKAEVLDFLFSKKAQSVDLAYENLAENIHEINFDAAVDEAVSQRNFRLAVRLLYLQTLKYLSDTGRIQYKPDKTNRQYVYELANSSLQPDFESLTRQFEFTWYGDFPIDETQFAALQTSFIAFNRANKQIIT
ncbi:DUF4129 domain-containing protein [Spirosoma fluviale]|uniref:Protein-glutamine gamma-glutamyltransferase-like C-terminal domain-containing protein n=1 Tax=Spirosoma fluviale TaxID=1597977 RepID=A0A286GIE2_9BACT|nr:DUF4129 domain-containing protein [Spirosoma fluviale]SOD95270.1 protein of unknown function [Spirosoma fluviale]